MMLGAAVLPLARRASAQAWPKPLVISSWNGVAACAKAMEMLHSGADTLDAVIAGVAPSERVVGEIGKIFTKSQKVKYPSERTVAGNLASFFIRPDSLIASAAMATIALALFYRALR